MGTNEARAMLADATARIFADLADPQVLARAKDDAWKKPLWSALEEAGLTRAWVPEALGGAGAGIADGFEILRVAGEHAVAVPLAETLVAGWLLSQAGLEAPEGMLTVGVGDDGRARAVPFAREAARIVVLSGRTVSLFDTAGCKLTNAESLAREPRDEVFYQDARPLAQKDLKAENAEEHLLCIGAVARASQMSGALQSILERSTAYANERVAFEKKIGKFQAIQHALARLAGETAAALCGASSAADALETAGMLDEGTLLETASAKIRVGEAASAGSMIAHQVHGAIGYSAEHVLHRYTQRLWSWRDDFGDEASWAVRLGRLVAKNGADALWPLLSTR